MRRHLRAAATGRALALACVALVAGACGKSSGNGPGPAPLLCEGGPCPGAGLTIHAAGARGCEVLLQENGAAVRDVTFDSSLKGTFIREAPRVAVSFVSATDQAVGAGAVRVVLSGGAASGLAVQKVSCVDGKANPIAGATASLSP